MKKTEDASLMGGGRDGSMVVGTRSPFFPMGRDSKGNTGKAKNSNSTTARWAPSAAAVQAGPVQALKDRKEV